MKIVSWNVNGIRAVMRKNFFQFLESYKPDILCLQETKIDEGSLIKEGIQNNGAKEAADNKGKIIFPGYKVYWNPAERKGYSGTAVLIKDGLGDIKIKNGFGKEKFDKEGRAQTMEFDNIYLINSYFPNANHALSRLSYKLDYNRNILEYASKLEKKKNVVICGDFNVAHNEMDLARPKENIGNPGFTNEERGWMSTFLAKGYVDTFRDMYPQKEKYSWWSYRAGARQRNVGWRIDYFCISQKAKDLIEDAFILSEVMGSDHCPVGISI